METHSGDDKYDKKLLEELVKHDPTLKNIFIPVSVLQRLRHTPNPISFKKNVVSEVLSICLSSIE
jgi:hypothetical protein